jgi:drug/metabolite transporter (DMT)-like permease
MKPGQLAVLLLMNFFWALVYSAYKSVGDHLSTGGIVTLRFGLAAVVFVVCWPWLPGRAPAGWDLLKTCAMGLILYVLGQRVQVYGNQLGTASNSAVLISLEPLVTSIAAAIFLREHIGPRRNVGFVLAIGGVVIMNGVWSRDFQWAGLAASLIFLSSFICEAAYSVMGKPITARASIMKTIAISLLVGTTANLCIDGAQTAAAIRLLTLKEWGLLLMLGPLCTAVGYTVWFKIIQTCPVNLAALTIFAQSIFGVIIAAVWLGEMLHARQMIGCVVIAAGIVVGLSRQLRLRRSASQASQIH